MYLWTSALYIKFETGFCGISPIAWEGHSCTRIRDSKEVNGWYDLSGRQLLPDTWYHYAFSYNAQTETAIAFIDGEAAHIMENVPTNRYVKLIILGGDVFQPSFNGNICELLIYNEPKDYNFIQDLYESYIQKDNFIAIEKKKGLK